MNGRAHTFTCDPQFITILPVIKGRVILGVSVFVYRHVDPLGLQIPSGTLSSVWNHMSGRVHRGFVF